MSPSIAQASAIPYRRQGGRVEVCMITSIRKGRWGFPKGIIDPGETAAETAIKEAEEEAGVRGHLDLQPVGAYTYAKWGTTLDVTVFLLEVAETDDDWPEAHLRQRAWLPLDRALLRLGRKQARPSLQAAIERLGE